MQVENPYIIIKKKDLQPQDVIKNSTLYLAITLDLLAAINQAKSSENLTIRSTLMATLDTLGKIHRDLIGGEELMVAEELIKDDDDRLQSMLKQISDKTSQDLKSRGLLNLVKKHDAGVFAKRYVREWYHLRETLSAAP